MGALIDELGNKSAGQLVRAADWDALVAAVDALQTQVTDLTSTVDQRFAAADTAMTALSGQVEGLKAEFDAFRSSLDPVTFRIGLQAERQTYALGEVATIAAVVASLTGQPLSAGAADRPWVDFVATWGQLRAAPGFDSVSGVGDRTMSVQTDASGTAKVQVVADHVDGFSIDAQDEVAASLTTQVAANVTVARAFLDAPTPKDAKDSGAMKVMADEYDRADSASVRSFVDAYHIRASATGAAALSPAVTPGFRDFQGTWQDHRATVMAFAKADQDPTTADESRGIGAVTIAFRDWIRPWIFLQYLDAGELATRLPDVRAALAPSIGADYAQSLGDLRAQVGTLATTRGVLGQQRDLAVIQSALGSVSPPGEVSYAVSSLTSPLIEALSVQRALQTSQLAAPVPVEGHLAFDAFANAASRGDASVAGVQAQIGALTEQVDAVKRSADEATTSIASLHDQTVLPLQLQIQNLDGRLTQTLADGGPISQVNQRLSTVETQTNALQAIDPSKVNDAIGQVAGLRTALEAIKPAG